MIGGIAVCAFASLGARLGASIIYTGASHLAAAHDAHWNFASTAALTGLAINLGITLVFGHAGKVPRGVLSSTSGEEVNAAFKLAGKDSTPLPCLRTGISEHAVVKSDWVSTPHLLLNNAFRSVAGCYGSLSPPCS